MIQQMLSEMIDNLTQLGRDTQEVSFHTHPSQPKTLWVRHGDELKAIEVPATPRAHKLLGLTALIAALGDKAIAPAPEVYVSSNQIVALLDRADRRDRIVVDLGFSKQFVMLQRMEAEARVASPAAIVKFLRIDLAGGVDKDEVIGPLSVIDFTLLRTTSSNVAHGRDGYGGSVNAEVKQAALVPQEFFCHAPVWTAEGTEHVLAEVNTSLFLDAEKQVVELRVLPDQCTIAINGSVGALVRQLTAELDGVPVFAGVP